MNSVEYRDALRAVLDAASPSVAAGLSTIHRAATARVDGVLLEVFLDQDAEGTFSIWARFDGADGFTLDRQLGDERELFSVIWGEEEWEPPVPPRPVDWSRQMLTDTIIDVVAEWISPLIPVGAPALLWDVATPDSAAESIAVGPDHD